MSDFAKSLEAARQAVTLAGQVTNQVQASLDKLREITKDDKSPVTVADFASQAVIAALLTDKIGPIKLVAEEASDFLRAPGHEAHLDAVVAAVQTVLPEFDRDRTLEAIDVGSYEPTGPDDHFWTLDPIDGTKGFLRNQQYAIALGYISDGDPVLGVMGCPNLPRDFGKPLDVPDEHGSIYVAARGDGLYEFGPDATGNDPDGPVHIRRLDHEEGQPISVCASVEKAHSNVSDADRILAHLATKGQPTGEPTRLDSQCKYAVTGRGQADAYMRLPTKPGYVERIWDHAAGAVVAAEAGCIVTDIEGKPLDFSHGRGLEKNRGVICAPPRVHALIIGAIAELGIGQA